MSVISDSTFRVHLMIHLRDIFLLTPKHYASHKAYQLCHRLTKSQTFVLPNYWEKLSTIFTCPWHTKLLTLLKLPDNLDFNFPIVVIKRSNYSIKTLNTFIQSDLQ